MEIVSSKMKNLEIVSASLKDILRKYPEARDLVNPDDSGMEEVIGHMEESHRYIKVRLALYDGNPVGWSWCFYKRHYYSNYFDSSSICIWAFTKLRFRRKGIATNLSLPFIEYQKKQRKALIVMPFDTKGMRFFNSLGVKSL